MTADQWARIIAPAISVGGGGLEGIGERGAQREDRELSAAERQKDREQRQRETIANYLSGREQTERNDLIAEGEQDRIGAGASLNALGGSPFGFASDLQKQRTRRDLLGNMRNVSITAPAEIEAVRGRISGGARIPEGGLDVSALSERALGENARTYLTNLAQINPRGTTLDVGAFGLDPGITGSVESARKDYLATDDARRQELRDIGSRREGEIMSYLTGSGPVGASGGANPLASPQGMPVPTENGAALDSSNDNLRAHPVWQNFMRRHGYALQGEPINLSDDQRKALKRELEGAGFQFPGGMEIDKAGNVNQDQGVSRYARGAANVALTAAPIAANFIPGVGPVAAAAISGAAGAAKSKMNGGSWGDAAKAGALGAGASYGMSKVPSPFRIPRGTPAASAAPPAYAAEAIDAILRGRPAELVR